MELKQLESILDPLVDGIKAFVERRVRAAQITTTARQDLLEGRVAELGEKSRTALVYRGTWAQGPPYQRGDTVTHGGAVWHCEMPTTDEPGTSAHFKLAVKRGQPGKSGERGPQGEQGDIPRHRWVDGTKLQFEQGPNGGEFGPAVELRGPKGDAGAAGGLTAMGLPIHGSGGPSSTTTTGFGYFPSGW